MAPEIKVRKRKLQRLDTATVSRQPADAGLKVKIIPNVQGTPPSKLADAELEFIDGPLEGLRLIGFAIWERSDGERLVTFPARQYSVKVSVGRLRCCGPSRTSPRKRACGT